MMEAANRGAHDAGAKSVGLNISLPHEQYPNPYITPQLCFQFHYFALRKMHFMMRAKAMVAFPGGYGTMDELFEVLTWSQGGLLQRPVGLLNVAGYFDPLIALVEHTRREGFLYDEHRTLLISARDCGSLLDRLAAYQPPDRLKRWLQPGERGP
jgi:uncharacterized protein (TIGR00730 family)